ncbi:MAG: RNA methyltransferase [Halobacteriota archaeon]|nr:RNA methyltransferase [Halobacteriota archaeon]
MIDLRVVLVEPIYCGNVGSVARAMKNFGFEDLVLVSPCELEREAYAMASHAVDVLESARRVGTVSEAVNGSSLVIGTTSKIGTDTGEHMRLPYFSPKELKDKLNEREGRVTILFGREDIGLVNDHIKGCDMVVFIPTNSKYPVMNLSHAVSIVLYELSDIVAGNIPLAKKENIERLYDHCEQLLDKINYPHHKTNKTLLMIRRILGRAELTGRELNTLRGILSRTEWKINRDR